MIKTLKYFCLCCFILLSGVSFSQDQRTIDSLISKLKFAKEDTNKLNILDELSETIPDDSWQFYNEQMGKLSQKLMLSANPNIKLLAQCKYGVYISNTAYIYREQGDITKALNAFNSCLELQKKIGDKDGIAHTLNELGAIFSTQGNHQLAIENYKKCLEIRTEMGDKKSMALVQNNIGTLYFEQTDIPHALEYIKKSMQTREEIGDKKGMADCFNAIGAIYYNQGNIPQTLEYYHKSLKVREGIKDKNGMAESLNNIGAVYANQEDFKNALLYFNKSLTVAEEVGDKKRISLALNNIAGMHENQHNYPTALECYLRSLKIREDIEDKFGQAQSLNNIGLIYYHLKDYTKALEYYSNSLKKREEIKDRQGVAQTLNNIGGLYNSENKYPQAIEYGQRSMKIATELGFPENIKRAAEQLADVYKKQRDFQKSLEMYTLYIQMRDSINNRESQKAAVKKQMQYEFDKISVADSIKNADEKKVKDAEIFAQASKLKQEKTQRFALYGGLLIVLVFSGFLYNRFTVTRKQKNIIEDQKNIVEQQKHEVEKQKELVEEHQKEIIDSITYAKRLQRAILPPIDIIKEHFPESFLLYKPKDIVAGDFYWMRIGTASKAHRDEDKVENEILIAAADSTGHGVPGAMVSVVCSNALNRSVNEFMLTEPGKILDKTTDLVLETFAMSGEEIKDGMDISLLSIDKQKRKISWSGANNQLWYIFNNVLIEVKADKQPVGKSDLRKQFTTNEIPYQEGTVFYLMTDGYPDQFGGPKGKKFKYKQLEELLVSICNEPLERQSEILFKTFDDWKGNLEQVDDVTIIGLKI